MSPDNRPDAIDERGVTRRRVEWNASRQGDWSQATTLGDRMLARELYEDFGRVLGEEIDEDGGDPVLSLPAINKMIREVVTSVHGGTALDVGCGPTPVAALALAEAGFQTVAVDIAHSICRLARRHAERGVQVAVADGEGLPFPDEAFDIVTCDDVIEHVFDQPALMSELARVLRPGGRLLLVTPNASGAHVRLARARDLLRGRRLDRTAYHITDSHVRELRWSELRGLAAEHFTVVESRATPFPPGRLRRLNKLRRVAGFRHLGPVHFVMLQRRAGTGPLAAHYAQRADTESQESPFEVRRAVADFVAGHDLAPPVLDVGCGVGSNLVLLSTTGIPVVGLDVSLSALRRASELAPVGAGDGCRLPVRSQSVGTVVCTEVLEHVADPAEVLSEVARVLVPGGLLYTSVPNYLNLAGLHKVIADRRSGRHDWNPWGAHQGGYEALMTGRKLRRLGSRWFEPLSVRGLDYGQAITGRFRTLDRLAWSRAGQRVAAPLTRRLHGTTSPGIAMLGMNTEIVFRKRATQ